MSEEIKPIEVVEPELPKKAKESKSTGCALCGGIQTGKLKECQSCGSLGDNINPFTGQKGKVVHTTLVKGVVNTDEMEPCNLPTNEGIFKAAQKAGFTLSDQTTVAGGFREFTFDLGE